MATTKVTKIKFHYKGFNQVRKSSSIAKNIMGRAERIAAAAGPGHVAELGSTPARAKATVYPQTPAAIKAEAEDKTLSKAIDAGR